jgi:leucyl-tRNA synthetase
MTPEEKILWRELRSRKFHDYKFRRQYPFIYNKVGRQQFYVADFYCASRKLVIELDGKYHEFGDQKQYDDARDAVMKDFGMIILRVKNAEMENLESVLKKIQFALTR